MNNDLISRSALKNDIWADIERLSELKSNYNCFDEKEEPYYRALSNAIQALRKEKQGEWIFVSRNCWKCPYCQELTNEGKNFCSNCGADMRGGADNDT